jgi:type III restriction enzyme
MLEPKSTAELDAPDVKAKMSVATKWCSHASSHAKSHGGKPWTYAIIPHNVIAENMTLEGLVKGYASA